MGSSKGHFFADRTKIFFWRNLYAQTDPLTIQALFGVVNFGECYLITKSDPLENWQFPQLYYKISVKAPVLKTLLWITLNSTLIRYKNSTSHTTNNKT